MPVNSDNRHSWVKHADFIALDLLSLALSFVIAYLIRFGDLDFLRNWEWIGLLVVACLVNIAVSLLTNPYSGIFRRTYYEDAMRMAILAVVGFISMAVLLFVFKVGAVYSRAMLGIMYVVYYVLSIVIKSIHKHRLLSQRAGGLEGGARSLLIVAYPKDLADVVENAQVGDFREYELTCVCCTESLDPPCADLWGMTIVSIDSLVGYVLNSNVDDVLMCVPTSVVGEEVGERLIANGVTVHFDIGRLLGVRSAVQSVSNVGLYQTLDVGDFSFGPGQLIYLAIKRLFDILIGIIGCIVLLPTTLIVKLAYLVSGDTARIFYFQERIGMRGRPFKLAKFRTMVPNAAEVLEELLKDPARRAEWEQDQKLENDPRITRVGRVLRRASIDEFPQFWNILKGDMSLVGPRPLIPGELESHGGLTLYNKVKPGITGWWACNGRSNISYRERLEMEYHYVRNCSLLLDITCIARTALAVIRKEGAK